MTSQGQQTIELNHDNCLELLKRYLDSGYSKGRCFSIKDGATLHKFLRILRKQEEDPSVDDRNAYLVLFKALELANSQGAFSLDDSAVLDRIITFLSDELAEKTKAPSPPEPKLKEL